MKVIISGGGTGGHIYPGLAIAHGLEARLKELELLFVGTREGLEGELVPAEGFNFKTISSAPLSRRLSPVLLRTLYLTTRGLIQSLALIRSFQPQVVVGTGGYVCGPLLLAAGICRLPILLQEQNAIPGLTTRLMAPLASRVALGFAEAAEYLKKGKEGLVVTGNPLRNEILSRSREEGAGNLGLDPLKRYFLIFGGSRGARSINRAVMEAYPQLLEIPGLNIIHITGKEGYSTVREYLSQQGLEEEDRIRIFDYLEGIADALALADLVLSRAGALGLAEILACGIPSVLVPYPHAAEGHQQKNASSLERAGAARVIADHRLDGERLAETVGALFGSEKRLAEMSKKAEMLARPEATERVVEMIIQLAG